MMKKTMHIKKIQAKYFFDIIFNNKNFEIRKNDCNYQVGDNVKLVMYDGDKPTEAYLIVEITYILKDVPQYGLDKDYCIFSFKILKKAIDYDWVKIGKFVE